VFKQFTLPGVTNNFAISEIQKYVLGEIRRAEGDKIPPDDSRGRLQAMMKKQLRTACMEMQM
jgi:hypothetical protein